MPGSRCCALASERAASWLLPGRFCNDDDWRPASKVQESARNCGPVARTGGIPVAIWKESAQSCRERSGNCPRAAGQRGSGRSGARSGGSRARPPPLFSIIDQKVADNLYTCAQYRNERGGRENRAKNGAVSGLSAGRRVDEIVRQDRQLCRQLFAQVSFLHFGIVQQRFPFVAASDRPGFQDIAAMGNLQGQAGVLLD